MEKTKIIGAGTKTALTGSVKYFKWLSFLVLFTIISITSIVDSINQKTPEPFIREVGGKIALTTLDLQNQSLYIINNPEIRTFQTEEFNFKELWRLIVLYSNLIFVAFALYIWIRIFTKVWSKAPAQFQGNAFVNASMGFLIFMTLQIIFLLIYYAMTGKITDFSSGARVIIIPFASIWLFFKAVIAILTPVSEMIDDKLVNDKVNVTNATIQ